MLAGILGQLLSSTFITPIINGAVGAYKAKLSAENTTDKILADVAGRELIVDQRQRELDAQMNVMDEGRWWTAAPRAIVTWTFALYIAKAVFWDNVLGLGTTPALHGDMADLLRQIMVVWFGGRSLEKITKTIVNRIK